jgi:hypothetical protein
LAIVHRFTDNPFLWKLCLLPWSLLLVIGVQGLIRRFAPRVERPLLVMLVFSPALLPSLNLMLDLPALALSLTALNLFFRATDRDSLSLAACAGLIAGIAMQTKYTAFLAPGVMFLWSTTMGRWRVWPVAVLVAIHVFASWELLVALLYGQSHFLIALPGGGSWLDKLGMLPFLSSQLGGLIPFVVALGLAALGVGRRWVWLAVRITIVGFIAVTLLDVRFKPGVDLLGRTLDPPVEFQLAEVIFNVFGLTAVTVVICVARRLLRAERAVGDRRTLFLVLWLGLEIVGFLALTPFPAARRVLGVGLVLSLLIGRLASRRALILWRRRLLPWLPVGGVLLALGYWALDWQGAAVQQRAVDMAERFTGEHGGGRVWYAGHWGFQFYAERCGMQPIVPQYPDWRTTDGPIRLPPATVFAKGDWLVIPESNFIQQGVDLPEENLDLEHELTINDRIVLRTVPCFYGGRTPLEHLVGPSLRVRIYRVRRGFAATPGEPGFKSGE